MPGVREGSAQRANLSGQGLLRDQWQPSLRQCPSSGQGVWGSQWGCPDRAQPLEPSTPSPRVGTSSRIALPSPSDTSPWHRTQQAGCACDSEFLPPSGVPWGFTLRARGSRHHPGLSAGEPSRGQALVRLPPVPGPHWLFFVATTLVAPERHCARWAWGRPLPHSHPPLELSHGHPPPDASPKLRAFCRQTSAKTKAQPGMRW